jgi:FkbM family methyltransferase
MIQRADRLVDKFTIILAIILYGFFKIFLYLLKGKDGANRILHARKISLETFVLSDIIVRIENCKYFFRKKERLHFAASETRIRDLLKGFLHSGGTFIDIGCNVGIQYTLPFARQLDQYGQVIAIDANPRNISNLRKNIELNSITNVTPLNLAISDHDGYSTFYLTGESWSGSLLQPTSEALPTKVQTSTIDSLISSLNLSGDIDLIKIDVEGSEVDCIKGATQTLQKTKHMLIECHSTQNKKEIERMLEGHFIIKDMDYLEDAESTHILCVKR